MQQYRNTKMNITLALITLLCIAAPAFADKPVGRPNIQLSRTPFSPATVSQVDGGRQREILKAYEWALSNGRSKFFTVAVGPKKSWATLADNYMTQSDRVLNVLQRCEHYEGTPCALFAVDGVATSNTKIQPSTIAYPKKFTARAVPFVTQKQRSLIESSYNAATGNRALVINSYGYYGISANGSSPETAIAEATQQCQNGSQERCFVYSVNDNVLFTSQTSITDKGF